MPFSAVGDGTEGEISRFKGLLNKFPGGDALHFFEHLAEVEGAFKTQLIRYLVDFHILFQQHDPGPAYLHLCDVFGEAYAAGLFEQHA